MLIVIGNIQESPKGIPCGIFKHIFTIHHAPLFSLSVPNKYFLFLSFCKKIKTTEGNKKTENGSLGDIYYSILNGFPFIKINIIISVLSYRENTRTSVCVSVGM
jgi:hypothetical protein